MQVFVLLVLRTWPTYTHTCTQHLWSNRVCIPSNSLRKRRRKLCFSSGTPTHTQRLCRRLPGNHRTTPGPVTIVAQALCRTATRPTESTPTASRPHAWMRSQCCGARISRSLPPFHRDTHSNDMGRDAIRRNRGKPPPNTPTIRRAWVVRDDRGPRRWVWTCLRTRRSRHNERVPPHRRRLWGATK